MDGRGLVGIGVGRGRVIFDRKQGWMLGKRRCRNIEVAAVGLDGRFGENATWKMTAVEGSIYSEVCLGVFNCFLMDFIGILLGGGVQGLRFHTF